MMNKIWKDETGSITGWLLMIFFVCALLFGWLPHVLMAKNHVAAMSNYSVMTDPNFGNNVIYAVIGIIVLSPLLLFIGFDIMNAIDERNEKKNAPERKRIEEEHKKWMEDSKFENVVARYMVQKEIEHPSSIVEKPGTTSINKYRSTRQQKPFDTMK